MKKQLKNIIASVLLGAALFVGTTVYAQGDFSPKTELYMNRLNALGIMSQTDDMTKTLTRGEMAKIICGVGEYPIIETNEKIFTDVPRDYKYADYINTAYTFGIINGVGDGKFAPDAEVTREQMYKMLLCTAGYQLFAENEGGFPTGYVSYAGKNSMIMPGAEGTVTVGEAAYTVFKALEMPVIRADLTSWTVGDNDDTLLEKILDNNDIEFCEGVLTFDGYSDLSGEWLPEKNIVRVDERKVINDLTNLNGLLGKRIEYFVKEDKMIAAYEYPGENNVVSFDAEDIDSMNGFKSYTVRTDERKNKTYRLSDAMYVVYNKQGISDYAKEDLIPSTGSVTLIDNNDDNNYDVVMVENRKYYVVDDASSSGLSVQFKKYKGQTENGYYISENGLDTDVFYKVTDGDGNTLNSSSIVKNTVVGVAKSRDGKMVDVIATKKMVEGVLSSMADDELTVGGITYKAINDDLISGLDIKGGDVVSVYLNENDKIIFCETETTDGNYAYVKKVYHSEDEDAMFMTVITSGNLGSVENKQYSWVKDKMAQNDEIVTYEFSDKVKVNGKKVKESSLINLVSEVVRIEMNSENKVANVEILYPDFEYTNGRYNHNTAALTQKDLRVKNYDNPAIVLSGNIKTLVIPKAKNKEYSNKAYMAKYRIENDSSNHNVAVYEMPDNSQTPRLIVLKEVLTESGTAQSNDTIGILTSNIRSGLDKDGEECYIADIYDANGNARRIEIRYDARRTDSSIKGSLAKLDKGDIIEFNYDSEGKINKVHIAASASAPVDRMQMGKIEKVVDNVIWNKTNGDEFYHLFYYYDEEGNRVEAGVEAEYQIFRYKNGKVEKIEPADIVSSPDGLNADTVIIAGQIAVILPVE